jgi:hypothetical protein
MVMGLVAGMNARAPAHRLDHSPAASEVSWPTGTGRKLEELDLVFSTTTGTPLDPANVRRAFRGIVAADRDGPRLLDTEGAAAQLQRKPSD